MNEDKSAHEVVREANDSLLFQTQLARGKGANLNLFGAQLRRIFEETEGLRVEERPVFMDI